MASNGPWLNYVKADRFNCIEKYILHLWITNNIKSNLLKRLHLFGVGLNTLIFFGRPSKVLQSSCLVPGFDSMSPSIRKIRMKPL